MSSSDDDLDAYDDHTEYRRMVETHLVEVLESSLQANGLSWTNAPSTEGPFRVYRDAVCVLSEDVAEDLSRKVVDAWILAHIDGLTELYALAGAEPDRLHFGVGPAPTDSRLSVDEFESRFRALVRHHVDVLGGSIAARLSTMIPRPVMEISRIEILLGAEATTDVYVIFDGEGGILSDVLGLDDPEEYEE